MTAPSPNNDDPLCAGLFGLQHGAACAVRQQVPSQTASSFARLFAASEAGGECAAPNEGTPDRRFT